MTSDMRLALVASLALVVSCGDDAGGGTTTGVSATTQGSADDSTSADSSVSSTVSASSTMGSADDTGTDGGSIGEDSQTEGGSAGSDGSTGGGSQTEGGSTGGSGGSTGDSGGDSGSGDSTGGNGGGDQDDDGLPDGDDPFPMDPDLPGFVEQFVIYAHTSGTLYTMDVDAPYAIGQVGNFSFPNGGNGSVTDCAIDRWGVLYVITFDNLHVCNPATAECYNLAAIGESSNGMTFIPPGVIEPADDSLIGIANSGSWRHMELVGNMVNMMVIGSYGPGYSSSGDAFSIENVGTYGSVNGAGFNDIIVEVDPASGDVLSELATLTGYTSTYGLAGWEGAIFAFDETGDVLLVDPADGTWAPINMTNQSWWGACVGTVIPQ
jgi:hypothetical protein